MSLRGGLYECALVEHHGGQIYALECIIRPWTVWACRTFGILMYEYY